MAGMEDLVIAGGTEMMSMTPRSATGPGCRTAATTRLRANLHPQPHQGVCADAIATLEGIGRARRSMSWPLVSQQPRRGAIAEGRFDRSLIPVYKADGTLALDHEEFPRPQTTAESLAGLKPAFVRGGPTTALEDQPRPTAS
jgi:acetyl-CoA C-acetyltransferase